MTANGKVSPAQQLYSIEAEWSLIGSGLIDPDVFVKAEVQPAMFHQMDCGEIWAAALELIQKGITPDLVTLTDALLRRGSSELPGDITAKLTRMLNSVPTAVHFASYAATIKDYYKRREAWRVSAELARAVTRKDDFDKSLARARDKLDSLTLQKIAKLNHGFILWAGELLDKDLPPPIWLVPDLLPAGCLAVLAGRAKLGKSFLALQLAVAVATGGKFLEHDCKPGKVLFFDLEEAERNLQDRLRQQGAGEGKRPESLGFLFRFSPLNEPEGMAQFIALLQAEKPALAIIDTLASAKNGKIDENSAEFADLLNPLRGLAQESGCTILFLYHHGKSLYDDPVLDLRGSSAIGAAVDVILGLYRKRGQKRATLSCVGRNVLDLELAMDFDKQTGCWQAMGEAAEVEQTENEKTILDLLGRVTEVDIDNLAEFTALTPRAVDWALKSLLDTRQVTFREVATTAKGRKKRLYFLPSAESGIANTTLLENV